MHASEQDTAFLGLSRDAFTYGEAQRPTCLGVPSEVGEVSFLRVLDRVSSPVDDGQLLLALL